MPSALRAGLYFSINVPMVGIFTTDANLILCSWDNWLAEATGIAASTACGQSLSALFPDLERRGLLARFHRVLNDGVVELLAPALHRYLIACAPAAPSSRFDRMRQRVTIAPLREDDKIIGTIVTVEDVTARIERERDLAEQLASPDEATRVHAAQALAEQEALDSADPLVGVLGDASWRVRRLAVEGLARHGGQGAVKSLLVALRNEHRNLSVLNSALQVLAMNGVDAIAPLVECLNDADTDLRIYAAHALGDQRDDAVVAPLINALADADANVRYHVIEALGKLRAADAVDALLGVVEAGDFYLAFPALDALAKIGDGRVTAKLAPLLDDEMLRGPAAEALGQLGDEQAIAPLVTLLNKPAAPTLVVAQALATLYERQAEPDGGGRTIVDLTRRAVDQTGTQNLLDALNEATDDELRALVLVLGWLEGDAVERAFAQLLNRKTVRKEVVGALAHYGTRVTELLIERLDSEEVETRQAAAIALGRIGDARAVPALVRELTTNAEMVIPAAGALAKIGDRRAFDALIDLIGHPQAAVRQSVVAAINSIGHPDMPHRAVELLRDEDPHVRESAVKIAGYFGYPQCRELLFERCRDEDENVRRAAIEHIPYLDDDRTLQMLADAIENGTARVRASAAQALGQVESPRTLSLLLAALNDADQWVRYFAARSIGRHAYAESADALAGVAANDPADHVRIAAKDALQRISEVQS
jgi:HEAT repeat protein